MKNKRLQKAVVLTRGARVWTERGWCGFATAHAGRAGLACLGLQRSSRPSELKGEQSTRRDRLALGAHPHQSSALAQYTQNGLRAQTQGARANACTSRRCTLHQLSGRPAGPAVVNDPLNCEPRNKHCVLDLAPSGFRPSLMDSGGAGVWRLAAHPWIEAGGHFHKSLDSRKRQALADVGTLI